MYNGGTGNNPNKKYMVWYNGKKVGKTYKEVCKDLGIIESIKFVQITTAGTITWTLGKPNEIKLLRDLCYEHGYKPSRKLKEFW